MQTKQADGSVTDCISRYKEKGYEVVTNAAELLSAKDGFLLQVEGGRVDHAGHGNDPAGILHEFLELTAVGWSSSRHTAECVELFAFGPGSQAIPPFLKNYEIFGLVTSALGIQA